MHHRLSLRTLAIVLAWLAIWQITAAIVANDILLAGPADVIRSLFMQIFTSDFWLSIAMSFSKIMGGFLLAFFTGILLGSLSFRFPLLGEILGPPLLLMKSVPVASFVILALIWAGSENLSIFISFFVVFPIIYVNTRSGLASTDPKLLEMAKVFHLSLPNRIRFLYLPALFPYLSNGCRIALGMGWKSGIAGEVIGVPSHTVGEHLYMSKIYLATADLFAWTLMIILISLLTERIFLGILGLTEKINRHCHHRSLHEFHKPHGLHDFRRVHNLHDLHKLTARRFTASAISAIQNDLFQNDSFQNEAFSLEIQNLCKSFGDQTILSNLSLNLRSGNIFCLMAPSGSGKTTLFRILLGLDSADSGNVNLHTQITDTQTLDMQTIGTQIPGIPIKASDTQLETRKTRSHSDALPRFSAVFQEDRLCEEFCALDNVMLVSHNTFSYQNAYTALCALLPAEAILRPISTLSGGQKRRVALCRALLAPSSILLMDEPFTGLDEKTRLEVIEFLKPFAKQKVLLISTHQAEDAEALGATVIHL